MVGEVMDSKGEPTTVIFLSQHNSQWHSKHLSLYPCTSMAFTHSKKLLFTPYREHYRKPQLVKMRKPADIWWLSPSMHYNTSSTPEAPGQVKSRAGKDSKRQKSKTSVTRQCLLYMTGSCTHEILTIWSPKHDLHNDNTSCVHGWRRFHQASPLYEEVKVVNNC